MSFRKMLKVSLLMLLAMALAATTAHARFDLFGKLRTSQNQPIPNSAEGVLQLLVKGKGKSNDDDESGAIPYTECIKSCDTCFCTRKWPLESNMCFCGDNSKSKKTAAAVQQVESSRSKVKSEMIPYPECIENCKGTCACTLIYPPELSTCICSDLLESTTAKAAEKLHKKLDLVSKPVAILKEGFLPYPECIEQCDECVICTRIYPIEKALCYCGKNTTSNIKKMAIQNSEVVEESHKKLDLVSKTVAISAEGFLPYPECIEKCDECVMCTRIYPIEKALCYCGKNTTSNIKKMAIQNSEVVEESHKKLDLVSKPVAILKEGLLPYPECIEQCDECVICTRIYPIEKALCYCGKNTTSNIKKMAIQNSEVVEESQKLDLVSKTVAISAEGFLPYPECIEKCDECVMCTRIYPIEKALCYCGKNTTSNIKKMAIQNSEVVEESQKLDLVSKTVAISAEGFLPYPECIEKCDECVMCTRIYPIEKALCYCGKNTTSNIKKMAIQNSEVGEESHKKLDLVSKPVAILKEGLLPYPECIEQCDECVICTRIYPIEKALCYCGKNTTSNIKKMAIQNSEVVEESHKKLDLVSKTVAISAEGFLPYPECIEQCDECVICTRIYPIEKALCYCGKKTTSNFQKWPIKNLGDDIKVVLWTKASSKAAS